MSDELRRAAERLEVISGNRIPSAAKESAQDWLQLWMDVLLVSQFYLAEHPADEDVPWDSDWREQAGLDLYHHAATGAELFFSDHGLVEINFECSRCDEPHYTELPHIKTRGDVRRLCRTLGIELKECTEQDG